MSTEKKVIGPWLSEWWTPARRAAMAERRKANPIGNRSKDWWTAHPDVVRAQRRDSGGRFVAKEDGG